FQGLGFQGLGFQGLGGLPQIRPTNPNSPPARSSQSGFSRVEKATAATASVRMTAVRLVSAACATIRAEAAISPIDNGTNAAWMIDGQREVVCRRKRRLT